MEPNYISQLLIEIESNKRILDEEKYLCFVISVSISIFSC